MDKLSRNGITDCSVTLPCSPDDFKEFIKNLLGKPQTIDKIFTKGTFVVDSDTIENIFHLVDQRINQQNESSLIQFTVKIIYDDDSSITLNSLEDFIHYKEIRSVKSEGVFLNWIYLIKFQQKRVPEKQNIELRFNTDRGVGEIITEDGIVIRRRKAWYGPGHIMFQINHTERTWGVDMESLLTGHVKTLLSPEDKQKNFISKNSGKIGASTGALFFVSSIATALITMKKFTETYLHDIQKISNQNISSGDILIQKIDFLVDITTNGIWTKFSFYSGSFIVISLIASIIISFIVEHKADNKPSSHVILSKKSKEYYDESIIKIKRDWILFFISMGISIVTGIISNALFVNFFTKI